MLGEVRKSGSSFDAFRSLDGKGRYVDSGGMRRGVLQVSVADWLETLSCAGKDMVATNPMTVGHTMVTGMRGIGLGIGIERVGGRMTSEADTASAMSRAIIYHIAMSRARNLFHT